MTDPKIMIPMIMNTTPGIHPGTIISAGRQSGKSYYQKMILNAMYNGTNLDTESIFDMVNKPKYKFSRAKWYVAEFNIADYTDVVHWCTEQFGPHPRNPDAWSRWVHKYEDKIHFSDEKDYVLFVLRWA